MMPSLTLWVKVGDPAGNAESLCVLSRVSPAGNAVRQEQVMLSLLSSPAGNAEYLWDSSR